MRDLLLLIGWVVFVPGSVFGQVINGRVVNEEDSLLENVHVQLQNLDLATVIYEDGIFIV